MKVVLWHEEGMDAHRDAWQLMAGHVERTYGVEVDPSGKDPGRLCFLSHDPDLKYREEIESFPIEMPEPVKTGEGTPAKRVATSLTGREVVQLLEHIPARPDYEDWIRVIGAVGSALPHDEAVEVLKEWSPEEQEGEYESKLVTPACQPRCRPLVGGGGGL